MDIVTITEDILGNLKNIESPLTIQWRVTNYSMVRKGDVLCEITYILHKTQKKLFVSIEQVEKKVFQVVAPSDGYLLINEYCYNKNYYYFDIDEDDFNLINQPIARIFESLMKLFENYYDQTGSQMIIDPYTKTKKIQWINENVNNVFKLDFYDDNALICFWTSEDVRKGDCVSLLFDDETIIDYVVIDNKTDEATCVLYQEDIEKLLQSKIISYRVTYKKASKKPYTEELDDLWDHPYRLEQISSYVKSYVDSINKLIPDYHFPHRVIKKNTNEYLFPGCYVYLMKDTSNGYHKIGISNTPEYRERTLQSEKPTIEMLACKKFPTRKIAESIESALHNAYSKQRLRGEWFNLNDADVAAIIETLK